MYWYFNRQQNKSIGDILKELVPFLVIYTNFVEHFHKCMKLMDWHRHNHSVYAALIEEVEVRTPLVADGRAVVYVHLH